MTDVAIGGISGDDLRTSIAAFYRRSIDEVYRYFHRATAGNCRLSEDLTQETFMACVRAAHAGTTDATTMPWIMGVARHKLIDHYRRTSREERKLSLVWRGSDETVDGEFDVTEGEALAALTKLGPLHRLVLVLRYLDDLTVGEVAAAIGRSVQATESLLVRARRSLHQLVKEAHDGI